MRFCLTCFTLFFIILFLVTPLKAQHKHIKFDLVSIEHGLSHNSVYSIIQDNEGFMWFGSENGLNRFDGYTMQVFRHEPANSNSLSSSNFGKVMQDSEGYLWLATWGGGLNRYDPKSGQFQHYLHIKGDSTSLSQNSIEFIFEDSEGVIWIGTEREGLNRFDKNTGMFQRFLNDPESEKSIIDNTLKAFLEPRKSDKGRLWFGTNKGISILDKETGEFSHLVHRENQMNSLSNNQVRSIMEDNQGLIWIGTRGGGLNIYDPETRHIKVFVNDPYNDSSISDNSITSIYQDSYGSIWVGTYFGGLNKYIPETDSFTNWRYDPENSFGLSHDRVEVIYEDRGEVLWIGTRGGGINKLNLKANTFNIYRYTPKLDKGLINPIVRAIANDPRNEEYVYIGTDGGGLTKFNRQSSQFLRHSRSMPGRMPIGQNRIWSLHVGHGHILWVGAYAGGLLGLDIAKKMPTIKLYQAENSDSTKLSNNTVHVIYGDKENSIWVGTAEGLNHLVFARDANYPSVKKIYIHDEDEEQSISNNYISSIYEGPSGGIWVGTRSGLNFLHLDDDVFFRFINDPLNPESISNDNIQAIYESENYPGILWVGTLDGGLNKIEYVFSEVGPEFKKVKRYYAKDGLSDNTIESIVEDKSGYLWITTSNGLNRFDPRTDELQMFDVGGDFRDQSFVRNSGYRTDDGEMFFGSINGLLSFWPQEIRANPIIPPIVITDFKVFNKSKRLPSTYYKERKIELEHEENYISFKFAALDFTNPKMNRYAYQMVGIDDDWIYLEKGNEVVYASIDPGEYIFKVKGSNNDGVWNEEGLVINVHVYPPWWQTAWARFLFSLVLLFAGYSIYQFRTRQIKQRAAVLEEMNTRLKNEMKEREKVEEEVRQLNAQLEERVADRTSQLELSNSELEAFAYTVSHDLRAPLRQIIGFNEAVIEDYGPKLEKQGRDYLERTHKSASQMHDLIEQMLKLSRVSQVELNKDEINISNLVSSIFNDLHKEDPERQFDLDIMQNIVVFADPFLIKQALLNLIHNAWKYTRNQKKSIFDFGAMEVNYQRSSTYTYKGKAYFLRDNGVGFSMEYADKLFKPFQRLHSEDDYEGTGIGLATVERIIRRHQGNIWVESKINGGTTFYFTLYEVF